MDTPTSENLRLFRALMAQYKIDAYVVPSADPHQTEYAHPHWRCRAWLSGFTGSAGTVAVMPEKAGLWTDGRYFIQAENELEGSGIDLFKMRNDGVPVLIDWLCDQVPEGGTVGVDGRLVTARQADDWDEKLKRKKVRLVTDLDLVSSLWKNRPALPIDPATIHPSEFSGRTTTDKLSEIRGVMQDKEVGSYLLSSLYDIAWLFNIRGNDTQRCPLLTAYALIEADAATLFVEQAKLTEEVKAALAGSGVSVAPYESVFQRLEKLPEAGSIYLCEERTSAALRQRISCKVVTGQDLTDLPKARKNEVELANWSRVQELDGTAVVRFWKWLEEGVPQGGVDECVAADRLEAFRRDNPECLDLSFNSISAFGANAAMMHYFPRPGSCAALESEGFYLIDSGGQYLGGTTDITRTFTLGAISDEQRKDYTLVLKGVINLSRARFLKGAAGYNLDVLARQPLWEHGLDYKCGTGHGVGCYLNVHEGPQNFSQHKRSDTPFEPGMVVTIEPGVYKEGRHGIRIENMVAVSEDIETECGTFYRFETMTLCPIDTVPLKIEMLSKDEIDWLNAYHSTVYKKLAPHLSAEENAWLEKKTEPVGK